MASGGKLNEALQIILNDLIEANRVEATKTELIEAENEQLRRRKAELLTSMNCYSSVNNSVVLAKEMHSRQVAFNQAQTEAKKNAAVRLKEHLREVAEQEESWKKKFQEVDSLMTLPHKEVVQRNLEMKENITANRAKIQELKLEYEERNKQHQENNEFVELLKSVEQDQKKLLEKFGNIPTMAGRSNIK